MRAASVGHQCPECVAQGRRTQRPVRTAFGATRTGVHGYATIGLIVANVVMFIASVISAKNAGAALGGGNLGGLVGRPTPLTNDLSVVGEVGCQRVSNGVGVGPILHCVAGISDGEYYRLFTAMFMHYGLLHIALNMWALWVLGRPLEAMFGPWRFLAVYLVCGLGGNVAAYVFAPDAAAAGASTAIFGLFGVFFFVLRKLNLSVQSLVPVLILNLVITFGASAYISVAGHIGGLITGGLIGYGFAHVPQQRRNQLQSAILIGLVIVCGVATVLQTQHLTSTLQVIS
ncbi:MAG TPA: rhomboid family intramembrane serine protease [Micromonosporaceae bacterium]|nr:rhomboid family intramembrane serine protease [Micromonosporaceae bacterium]